MQALDMLEMNQKALHTCMAREHPQHRCDVTFNVSGNATFDLAALAELKPSGPEDLFAFFTDMGSGVNVKMTDMNACGELLKCQTDEANKLRNASTLHTTPTGHVTDVNPPKYDAKKEAAKKEAAFMLERVKITNGAGKVYELTVADTLQPGKEGKSAGCLTLDDMQDHLGQNTLRSRGLLGMAGACDVKEISLPHGLKATPYGIDNGVGWDYMCSNTNKSNHKLSPEVQSGGSAKFHTDAHFPVCGFHFERA